MPKRERERIGPFVVTGADNLSSEGILCAQCRKLISRFNQETDAYDPTCEELVRQGAVPVPNFGWFCSQECGSAYEVEFGVTFQRDRTGAIQYYGDE